MEILLKQGDRLSIPDGCKATLDGNEIIIEKKENEFKDGDILHSVFDNTMVIFKSTQDKDFFYTRYNTECLEDEDWKINDFRLATDEEKQLLFDKMKEQGLRWNAEGKRVEKIRWRAEKYEGYYYFSPEGEIYRSVEYFLECDNKRHDHFNYFRTQEQSEKAAEVVKEALRKFHEENG